MYIWMYLRGLRKLGDFDWWYYVELIHVSLHIVCSVLYIAITCDGFFKIKDRERLWILINGLNIVVWLNRDHVNYLCWHKKVF